jgi:phospholipid transport system substrate-binding protein
VTHLEKEQRLILSRLFKKIKQMNFTSLIALTLFLIFNFLSSETGKESEIRAILEARDQKIKELVGPADTELSESRREELRVIINDMMDFREIARFALADKFDELEKEEQKEFIDLFSRIIRDQSLQQLDIYRAEIIYENIEVHEDEAIVTTTAILEETRIPVNYRMLFRNGEWVFTDMSIDDAWTGESYRRSFQNIIRRRGYDALIENLRKRAEQT